MKCLICNTNHMFFHYWYPGDGVVKFPTCKKCFNSNKKNYIREDIKKFIGKLYEEGDICNFHRKGMTDEIFVVRTIDLEEFIYENYAFQGDGEEK